MKNILFVFLGMAFFINAASQNLCLQQECSTRVSLNLSTGVNDAGVVIPPGTVTNPSRDPFWRLTQVALPPAAGVSMPDVFIINRVSNTWNNIPGTGAVSSINGSCCPGTTNNVQPWRFRREFCVCSPTTVRIEGDFRADNAGTLNVISETGVAIATVAGPVGGTNAFTIPNTYLLGGIDLNPGRYFIDVELFNSGSHMGFALDFRITDENNSSTLSNPSPGCCVPPPPPPPGPCCNIEGLEVKLSSTIYKPTLAQTGVIVPAFEISGGSLPIQEVEVSLIDYHVTYNDNNCRPQNGLGSVGHIAPWIGSQNAVSYDFTRLPGLLTAPATPALNLQTSLTQITNSLTWNTTSTPLVMNMTGAKTGLVKVTLSSPGLLNLSCCSGKVHYCFMVKVKDVNCDVCERVVCGEAEIPKPLTVMDSSGPFKPNNPDISTPNWNEKGPSGVKQPSKGTKTK